MAARTYTVLCAALGVMLVVAGLLLFAQFFRFHAPGGSSLRLMPMGPNGHYFVAFTGAALVGWGGSLLGAARHPEPSRSVGTATAVALAMCGFYRMVAWVVGDYALLGNLPRAEAALLFVLALAFIWLRPRQPVAQQAHA